MGGFGSAVLDAANELGLDASCVTKLALPDSWVLQNPRSAQLAETGLDAAGIARAIRQAASGESNSDEARSQVEVKEANRQPAR